MRKILVQEVESERIKHLVDFDISNMSGMAFSGSYLGKLVFLAGVQDINPGCGEIWIAFQVPAEEYPGAWFAIKTMFNSVIPHYRRLQSHVLWGSVSVGFNKHLGMVEEGIMRKYVGDRDYVLMARVE